MDGCKIADKLNAMNPGTQRFKACRALRMMFSVDR